MAGEVPRQQDSRDAESRAAKKYSKLTPAKCLVDLARRTLCVDWWRGGERQKTQDEKQVETARISKG